MAELRPRSFRIDEETAEKFKKICLEAGLNQQEALAKLIESYELQAGKAVLTEKRDEIEVFERYTSILIQKYMSALEEIQDSRETIRSEFKAQLDSKDALICDLQAQKKAAEEATKEADQLWKDMNRALKRCNELEETLANKDQLNKALTDTCNELRAKVASLEADQQQMEAIKKELEATKAAQAAGKKALEDLREKMEVAKERAVLDAEKSLRKEHETEIREINQRYAELISGKLRKPEEVTKEK